MKQWELRGVTIERPDRFGGQSACPVCGGSEVVMEVGPVSSAGACGNCGATWVRDKGRPRESGYDLGDAGPSHGHFVTDWALPARDVGRRTA